MSRVADLNKTMTQCGSPLWCAPEVLEGKRYDGSCDVYSFAIIFYEILTWTEPFEELNVMEMMIEVTKKRVRPPFPQDIPEELRAIINSAWAHNPQDRYSFREISNLLQNYMDILDEDGSDDDNYN